MNPEAPDHIMIRPYLDAHGRNRAESPEGLEALAGFLEQDVQSSVTWCDELLSILQDIDHRVVPTWEGTGNTFTLTLDSRVASLQCEYDDGTCCCLAVSDFRAALQSWRSFIAFHRLQDVD